MAERIAPWLADEEERRKPLTDEAGEVRELNRADFRAMRPLAEVLPAERGMNDAPPDLPKGPGLPQRPLPSRLFK